MEKSAAYLAGFQVGFDETLGLEKVAQLIELLEFVPENEQQAQEFLQKNAGFMKALAVRMRALKGLFGRKKKPLARTTRAADVPASLNVYRGVGAKGTTPRTFDLPGVRGTTRVERNAVERKAKL
jgi:hypothetical protein